MATSAIPHLSRSTAVYHRSRSCQGPCTHPAGGHPSEVEGLSLAGELDSAVDAETGGVLGRLPCERP